MSLKLKSSAVFFKFLTCLLLSRPFENNLNIETFGLIKTHGQGGGKTWEPNCSDRAHLFPLLKILTLLPSNFW